jgi:CDP-6-deoxy-D-xylo-4-hexulose-3-dehydrase
MQKLEQKGIETRPLFGCIPTQQPAYSYLKSMYEGRLSIAEHIGEKGFYIGCHQYLNNDDLDFIGEIFSQVVKHDWQ